MAAAPHRRKPNKPRSEPRLQAARGVLLLDDAPWFMRGGEFQYFRIERRRWERDLAAMRGAGFNAISTYVPWIWHELAPGHYDFAGATDTRRDLLGFLRACKAEGLPVVVKPGPFIYSEYQGFGQPRWLERTIPQALVLGPRGKPLRGDFWAAYSLGHPDYRAAVRGWYETLAAILADFWHEPVVAWQLDNETGSFFGNGLGKWDFNPDTVRRFQNWLREQYPSLHELNTAWGAHYRAFSAINPPRLPLRRGLIDEWQRFLQSWVGDYLGWLRATALEVGVPVPLTHNDSANFQPPTNPADKAASGAADLYGFNIYIKLSATDPPADYAWGSACSPAYFLAVTPPDKPLLAWELGAGWADPRAKVSDDTYVQNLFGCLAHGLKGFSLYTAHDGAEPDGAPYSYNTVFDKDGKPGPRYEIARRAHDFIAEHEQLLLDATPVPAAPTVGFAFYYPDFRFRVEDYLPLIGLQDPPRVLALILAHFGVFAALTAAGYGTNLRLFDLEHANDEDLAAYHAIVLPSKGNMTPAIYARLRRYVEAGGHLITTGIAPLHDLLGRPLDTGELYPHQHAARPARPTFPGRLPALLYLGQEWLLKYMLLQRPALKRLHPTSMHVLDLAAPLSALMRSPQFAAQLTGLDGGKLRGDYVVSHFGGRGHAILRHHGHVAGYAVPVGSGSSTVIGSQPGGSYFTQQYYRLTTDERAGIRDFWRGLLANLNAPPGVSLMGDLDIEVQLLQAGDARLLFVLNRLPQAQSGRIRLPGASRSVQQLFAWHDAHLAAGDDGWFDLRLAPLAVLVCLLEQ